MKKDIKTNKDNEMKKMFEAFIAEYPVDQTIAGIYLDRKRSAKTEEKLNVYLLRELHRIADALEKLTEEK